MLDRPILAHKGEFIREAHNIVPFRSFADLGGCWGVNGGYTFHARDICGGDFERAVIVDGSITPLTRQRAEPFTDISLVEALLGSAEARRSVGKVDALIMFDILLHQVSPNWDQFILDWMPSTDMLIIYNQNWLKSDKTVRFIDYGLQWYKENVIFSSEERLSEWFATHSEFDHKQNKHIRDIHNFWQWGITPNDIIDAVTRMGFDLVLMKRFGNVDNKKRWIVNDGLVFVRSEFR